MTIWILFPSFSQLAPNRRAALAALETAGLRFSGDGAGGGTVTTRNDTEYQALWNALADNRTSDGVWPFGARSSEGQRMHVPTSA